MNCDECKRKKKILDYFVSAFCYSFIFFILGVVGAVWSIVNESEFYFVMSILVIVASSMLLYVIDNYLSIKMELRDLNG